MSASCYTHRIKVRTQSKNAKVQYPGGRAMYNSIHATCAVNPDYTVLKYIGIPLACILDVKIKSKCCQFCVCDKTCGSCIIDGGTGEIIPNQILDGRFSNSNIQCILDGGFSSSEYYPILDGGLSCYTPLIRYDGSNSSSNNFDIIDGGTSATNSSNIADGGSAIIQC